jgi:hypothetical protein
VWRFGDMRGWDGNFSESKSIEGCNALRTEENVDFGHDLHVGRGSRNQIIFEYSMGTAFDKLSWQKMALLRFLFHMRIIFDFEPPSPGHDTGSAGHRYIIPPPICMCNPCIFDPIRTSRISYQTKRANTAAVGLGVGSDMRNNFRGKK